MEKMLVSITTATYNCEKTLERTIRSVLEQTYPRIEYIIKDGGSTDRTVEIARSFEREFAEKGIPFFIISQKDNGMYDALNYANTLASGLVVGNVNSDDYYEKDAVETVVREYEKEPFDMIYGDLRIHKRTGDFIKRAKLKKLAFTRYWNHPTTFIAKAVLDKEKYRCESMYDDCDLMLRIRKKGYRVRIVHKVLSNFSFGGMSTRKSWKETRERIRIRNKVYRNNGYGLIYCLDGWIMETLKYLLG